MKHWKSAFDENPLIAILRGLQPEQAIDVAEVLVSSGFTIIEVPMNSPEPLISIQRIADKFSDQVVVGAGTVLTADEVFEVAGADGQLIVAPNVNPQVGAKAISLGVSWCPGVTTPSEAFQALELGASMLKFFPAELISPAAVRAMRAVLPKNARVVIVGGITPEKMSEYLDAGADGFGLGSALFKPDYSLKELEDRAIAFVSALNI
ncbi:MAG: 2-dehydro-3-deoxy-6-phosphogalactonate aldolase [Gammaproteobacteria bacterium]|nr:2-dehydro-3-deoxy-6-phosphogalactonate aldolase [Gammaproteobacteria bacterium]